MAAKQALSIESTQTRLKDAYDERSHPDPDEPENATGRGYRRHFVLWLIDFRILDAPHFSAG